MPADIDRIMAGFNQARAVHQEWLDDWEDVTDYVIPRKGGFVSPITQAEKVHDKIYDTTAPRANQKAAAGLFSRASNPATQWFFMTLDDIGILEDDQEARKHLDIIQRRMAGMINRQLANPLFQIYRVLIPLGTACLFVEEDPLEIFRGTVFPLKDIFIKTDHMGDLDTVYRRFRLTARQATQKWDIANLSDSIRAAAVSDPEKGFGFLHVVEPRADAVRDMIDNVNMPFASVYIELGGNKILEEGGYHEMPYMVPRLDVIDGEDYGRGVGMEVWPSIKTVNSMVALIMDAANMAIRPPMDVPVDSYITPFRLTPAAINQNQEPGMKASPITTFAGDIGITFNILEEQRAAIRDAFFNDQLQLLNQPNMTATEVLERVNQNMFLLGPWLVRLEKELFKPMIDRVFGIMQRRKLFPPVPESLANQELKIVYDSPLARAQRNKDVEAIDDMVIYLERAMQIKPGVVDNFDFDAMSRQRAEIKGLNHVNFIDEDEVQMGREMEARAAAEAAQAEQAQELLAGAEAIAQLPGGDQVVAETLSGGDVPDVPEEELE
jgi:hypothetical protein